MSQDSRLQVAQTLREQQSVLANSPVVAGFDGFVDELIRVVDERHDLDNFDAVPLSPNSELMAAAAGRSSLREIVIDEQDAGGCAVNLGDGMRP